MARDTSSLASVATKLHTFPGQNEGDFRRWLFRIATNAVNAYLRQSRRRQKLWQAAARIQQLGTGRTMESKSEGDVLDWPAVYQAVLELDEREQTILTLRFFAGCSQGGYPMRTVAVKELTSNPDAILNSAQKERIIVSRKGRPCAVIVGIEDYDEEDLQIASSQEFWRMVRERRRSGKSYPLAEVEARLNGSKRKSSGKRAANKHPSGSR
jgi:prevent-host-death family protein